MHAKADIDRLSRLLALRPSQANVALVLGLLAWQAVISLPAFALSNDDTNGQGLKAKTTIDSDFESPAGVSSMDSALRQTPADIKLNHAPLPLVPGNDGGVPTELQLPSSLTTLTPSGSGEVKSINTSGLVRPVENRLDAGDHALLSAPRVDGPAHSQAGSVKTINAESGNAESGKDASSAQRNFERGFQLIAPAQDTVLDTPLASVSISANALAFVVASDRAVLVYDLHDSHKGSIVIKVGDQSFPLLPGRTLAVADNNVQSFEQINPTPAVGFRKLTAKPINAQTKLYQCEYDITGLVRCLGEFKQMLSSHDARQRKIAENVLKNAALLMQLASGTGRVAQQQEPFLYMVPRPDRAATNIDATNTSVSPSTVTENAAADAAAQAMAATSSRPR